MLLATFVSIELLSVRHRGEISGQFEGGRFSSAGLVALLLYCWGGSHLCLCIRLACCRAG